MAHGKRQQTWFPFDMVAEILLRLPVKSLKRFQCVCKPWCGLISDSCFVMEHANRAKKGTEHLKLLVSMQPPESIDYEASLKHEGDGHVVASRRLELDLSRYPYPETSRNDLVYIVGSCNGLICLHGVRRVIRPNHQDFILVWNPSTGDTCKLPEHPSFIDDHA
ncbi:hypothetical protein M0R45_032520 [Rubus argutus]|uniref:F-box domain-containing protein n=1 Tax=Rubus argutus TaxID=59490 RepID=A0AAW1WKI0_RUBAR